MNRMMLMVLGGALGFALLTAMGLSALSAPDKEEAAAQGPAMTSILVATRALDTGATLGATDMAWASWPAAHVFEGAIVRTATETPAEALEGRLRRPVSAGEPLTRAALIDDTKSNFVAAALPKGLRAMSVSTNAETAVGGFVSPGDRVDVILTYDVRLPMDDAIQTAAVPVVTRAAAETILENVLVMATDQQTGKQAEAKPARTVTLAVDPKGVETLALATSMGTLSLSLRGVGDTTSHLAPEGQETPEATTDIRLSRVMAEIMRGENNAGSPTQIVRLYHGSSAQNVEVRPTYALTSHATP